MLCVGLCDLVAMGVVWATECRVKRATTAIWLSEEYTQGISPFDLALRLFISKSLRRAAVE